MIPNPAITAWGANLPWPSRNQIEQDLLLSRMIIELANHPYLGNELAFRGGTCFHKLHLPRPFRYSEDLDYVRSTPGGIANITAALSQLGNSMGFQVSTRISQNPKVRFRAIAADGTRMRLKVEINTHERSPAAPLVHVPYTVDSPWFTGNANVRTFVPTELVATKIRALYQRKKGRDLFDLWLALTELHLEPKSIVEHFMPYRPDGFSAKLAIRNLAEKVSDQEFREDLIRLINQWPAGYDLDDAASLVTRELLSAIPY